MEATNKLINSIEKEIEADFKKRLEEKTQDLINENKMLKEKLSNLHQLEIEYGEKINNIEQSFYDMSMREVFENYIPKYLRLYKVDYKLIGLPKCNFCDYDRKLEIIDVFGRKHKVNCKCASPKRQYYVYLDENKKMKIEKDGLILNLKLINDDYDYDSMLVVNLKTNETKFEHDSPFRIIEKFDEKEVSLDHYRYNYFTSKEEAQKYADYLNNKEEEEENEENKND